MPFWTPVVEGLILLVNVFCFGTAYLIFSEQKDILRNLEKAVKLDVNKDLEHYLQSLRENGIEYAGIRGKIFFLVKRTDEPIYNLQDIVDTIKRYGRYIITDPYSVSAEAQKTDISYPFTLYSPTEVKGKVLPFTVYIDSISWGDKFRMRSNAFGGGGVPVFYGMRAKYPIPEEGMIITVFGKVTRTAPGEIRIQFTGDDAAPFIFTKSSPEELISTQRYYINMSRVILFTFTIFGMTILGKFIYEEWKKYYAHRQRLKIFDELLPAIAEVPNSNTSNNNTSDEEHRVCVICKTTERNTLFLECNHVCVCQECARKANGVCPICSRTSDHIIPAYIS